MEVLPQRGLCRGTPVVLTVAATVLIPRRTRCSATTAKILKSGSRSLMRRVSGTAVSTMDRHLVQHLASDATRTSSSAEPTTTHIGARTTLSARVNADIGGAPITETLQCCRANRLSGGGPTTLTPAGSGVGMGELLFPDPYACASASVAACAASAVACLARAASTRAGHHSVG